MCVFLTSILGNKFFFTNTEKSPKRTEVFFKVVKITSLARMLSQTKPVNMTYFTTLNIIILLFITPGFYKFFCVATIYGAIATAMHNSRGRQRFWKLNFCCVQ